MIAHDRVDSPAEARRCSYPASSLALLTIAVTLAGDALRISLGSFHLLALTLLSIVLGICLLSLLKPRFSWQNWLGENFHVVLPICVGVMVYRDCTSLNLGLEKWRHFLPAILALAISAICLYRSARSPGSGRSWFAACLFAWLIPGIIVIHNTRPLIDVIVVHQDSARALLEGRNPIALTFPLPAGQDINQARKFYQPGDLVDGRINFGYPYPPLSLLLVLPAFALTGDYRYTMLAALALAAWLVGTHRRDVQARLAPMLLLYCPVTWYVLSNGWTEPLLILLLAATVVAAVRRPWLTYLLFGLFVSVKQYLFPAFAAAPALLRGIHWRKLTWLVLSALAIAVATVLPFYLWDPAAFVHTYTHGFPVRMDALSFNVILVRLGISLPAVVLGIPAVLAAILLAWKVPLTPSGFALSLGIFYFAVFLFASIAFCNYYYFVIGALCVSIATAE